MTRAGRAGAGPGHLTPDTLHQATGPTVRLLWCWDNCQTTLVLGQLSDYSVAGDNSL